MVEFVLCCIPVVVYVLVQARRPDMTFALARERVGATLGGPSGYAWAAVLLIPLFGAAWLAILAIPEGLADAPGVTIARVTSLGAAVAVVLRAAGEELLFRGLLGGIFMRRLGVGWGNLLQAAVFLVPHLPLLLVDLRLWPIIPVQFVAGWLLGWLRERTGSVVPGIIVHALANVLAGIVIP